MEISVEVNKYLAEEMAHKVLETISEEELIQKAKIAWQEINISSAYNDSTLNKKIKEVYLKAVTERVTSLIAKEEYQEQIKNDAIAVVDEIISKSREKMIEEVSNKMAGISTGYGGCNLTSYIQHVVQGMLNG